MDLDTRALQRIDWNFSDYNSSQFPVDINSLHWYPAAFVPQIPAILIEALSKPGDLILDPFAGSGITLIEAARLDRRFIGIDINPFAVNIAMAKIQAISAESEFWFDREIANVSSFIQVSDPYKYCQQVGIDQEVVKWFDIITLSELIAIYKYIRESGECNNNLLRVVIFSSILNRCCSQREHYTYITDRCFPKKLIYRPAIKLYLEQLELISRGVKEARDLFSKLHNFRWDAGKYGIVRHGDARDISWIQDQDIDLVITSPPYLGVNDYVRSMRLTHLFFPEENTKGAIINEIGARRKRHRKQAFEEYVIDMKKAFAEIARVLRAHSFLCLVLGQGRGKINRGNLIEIIPDILQKEHGFKLVFQKERKIKFRRIQVPGVGNEMILVFQRDRRY